MNKKVIGLFLYEPAMFNNKMTSAAGLALVYGHIVKNLVAEGHEVVWMGPREVEPNTPPKLTKRGGVRAVKDLDVLFVAWRWQLPDGGDKVRNRYLIQQHKLLLEANRVGTKIIIHDGDHKVSVRELDALYKMGAIFTAPETISQPGYQSLVYPNPYKEMQSPNTTKDVDMAYIGNNYERYRQTLQFIQPFQVNNSTRIIGNWMMRSKSRERPEDVEADFPNVEFLPRIPNNKVIWELSKAWSTIHLAKPSYNKTGFITMRWAEAVAAKTLAFIPAQFQFPQPVPGFEKFMVINGHQMVQRFDGLRKEDYDELLAIQKKFVDETMTIEPWLELLGGGYENES